MLKSNDQQTHKEKGFFYKNSKVFYKTLISSTYKYLTEYGMCWTSSELDFIWNIWTQVEFVVWDSLNERIFKLQNFWD